MADITIEISDIAMWIAIIIFLSILAWWVLGDSPTTEIIGLGLTAISLMAAWKGERSLKVIKANSYKQIKLSEEILEKVT